MTRYVVIIGAARSGTKLLRDTLAAATGVGKVPYDIGFVWRMGNEGSADDALVRGSINVRRQRFIRQFIDSYAAGNPPTVIEKTVGNALRVPMVAEILRDASFVHILRDGVDVIESTMRQWTAPADIRYLARKIRTVPVRLLPRYGAKYAASLVGREVENAGQVGSWGPRYPGIDHDLRTTRLLTVCARQWRSTATQARHDIKRLGVPATEVRYEDLVRDAKTELLRIADFAGLSVSKTQLATAACSISSGGVGRGRATLCADELEALELEIGEVLEELGYGRPLSAGVEGGRK